MNAPRDGRKCTLEWCSRRATHTAGEKTGWMFYLCSEHAAAVEQAPPLPGVR